MEVEESEDKLDFWILKLPLMSLQGFYFWDVKCEANASKTSIISLETAMGIATTSSPCIDNFFFSSKKDSFHLQMRFNHILPVYCRAVKSEHSGSKFSLIYAHLLSFNYLHGPWFHNIP